MNGTLSQNDPLAVNMFFFFSCHREFQYIIGQVCRPWHLTLASMDIKLRLQCGPAILETVISTCRSGCRTRRGPVSHLPTTSVAGDRLFSMPALDIRMNALLKKRTHAQAQRWYLSWSYHTSVLVDSRGESARIPASDIPKPRGHRQ